ncbi:MAG: hypothetical protein DRQ02_09220, partial [Candidatus Latescibacterota bacterium]
PTFGKLVKNRKEIWSLKGLPINRQSYLLKTFCPCGDRQEGGVSEGISNRKVRREVAKIAKS